MRGKGGKVWVKMPKTKFDVKQFDVKLYEKILRRGLSSGVGDRWPKNKSKEVMCG